MTTSKTMFSAERPESVWWEVIDSPLGEFLLAGARDTLVEARLPATWSHDQIPPTWLYEKGALGEPAAQLGEYFDGKRMDFELRFAPQGTAFQRSVWGALTMIPYGGTETYKEIATSIGNERATRAVGLANNRNPIALFIPCHRVIGSDGSLTGYGGGLEMKTWLLDHERKVAASR